VLPDRERPPLGDVMAITIGTIRNITFQVTKNADVELGNQVRLQLARYADQCPSIKSLINQVSAVTVEIKIYKGSGAVTIHRTKKIIVSKKLKGGVAEIAESALFELINWSQGDFAKREQGRLKNNEITPKQAGLAIAKCEAYSVHSHGEMLKAIKAKGIALSNYGEKQCNGTLDQSLATVEQTTMASAHDNDAPATDMMSLKTPEMYWYQTIDGTADADMIIRAVNNPPAWLKFCIQKTWLYCQDAVSGAAVYVKLLNLAKLGGCTLKGGFEFSAPMKIVASEMTVLPRRIQMSTRSLTGEAEMPGGLAVWLKAAKLTA
jgi:hypothetical protein